MAKEYGGQNRRFLADVMLKNICRWLRIAGIDAMYPDCEEDSEIIAMAEKTGRILLSMDREMIFRAKKRQIQSFLVPKGDAEEQLNSIFLNYSLATHFPDFTRCPACNSSLSLKKRSELVKEQLRAIPPNTRKTSRDFWICSKCGKIYWRGGHWKRISKMMEGLKSTSSKGKT